MNKRLILIVGVSIGQFVIASLLILLATQPLVADPALEPQVAATEALRSVLAQYVADYNRQQAESLAAHWSEQGVLVDTSTGQRITGRDAIQADYAALFDNSGALSLEATLDSIRFIRPDIVEVMGRTVTTSDGANPCASRFTAMMVRRDDRWFFESVIESLLSAPSPSSGPLQPLEFLVGRWVDDSSEQFVETIVRWSADRSFLVRSYLIERDDGTTYQGTQVIGWDPRRERFRSWTFDASGSFGEETWMPTDDGWIITYAQSLSDGRVAGGTQVLTVIDQDTLTVQSIGREISGDLLPAAAPVRVVRVAPVARP